MSRVDLATKAQTPVDFNPTSICTPREPEEGSVHIGVQSGALPSQPRIACIQVAVQSPGHGLFVLAHQVIPDLPERFLREYFQ